MFEGMRTKKEHILMYVFIVSYIFLRGPQVLPDVRGAESILESTEKELSRFNDVKRFFFFGEPDLWLIL